MDYVIGRLSWMYLPGISPQYVPKDKTQALFSSNAEIMHSRKDTGKNGAEKWHEVIDLHLQSNSYASEK